MADKKKERFTEDTVVKAIKTVFDDEQLLAKGRELSVALNAITMIEEEKRSANEQFKARLAEEEKKVLELSEHVRLGFVWEDKMCRFVKDYKFNEKRFYDASTGDLLVVEPLDPKDRQLSVDEDGGVDV